MQNSFILQRVISFILSWILNNKDLDTVHHRMCSVFFLSVSGKTQHINFQFPVIKMRYPHFYCRQSKRRSEPWKIKRNETSSLLFSYSFFSLLPVFWCCFSSLFQNFEVAWQSVTGKAKSMYQVQFSGNRRKVNRMKNFALERINEKINDIKRCQKFIFGEFLECFIAQNS